VIRHKMDTNRRDMFLLPRHAPVYAHTLFIPWVGIAPMTRGYSFRRVCFDYANIAI